MPRIPQYYSEESIRTGSTGPHADASSFGLVGLERVGQGLANLGGSITEIAEHQAALKQRKKVEDERQWVGESVLQLERVFTDFHADEQNQSKETFATDFDEFSQKQIQEYSRNAPSGRASKDFTLRAGGMASNYRASALRVAESTRLTNQKVSLETQTGDALQSYRNNLKAGTAGADELLAQNINDLLDYSEATFANSPKNLAAAREFVIKSAVLATSKSDPGFAQDILDAAPYLDEPSRKALQATIEADSKTGTAYDQEVQRQILDKALDAGERGQLVEPPNEAALKQAFGDDRGAAMALSFREKAGHINEANSIVARLSDKNAGYQDAEFSKLSKTAHGDVLRRVQPRLEAIQRQQEKDPAGFLRSHNPEVQTAYERAVHFGSPAWENVAHSMSLKYQGYAPPDATPEEAAKYLNLPDGQRHILSAEAAKTMGARLAQGSISDQLGVINEMLAGFDEQHQYIAFNDLVKYADIPPALQLAHLNQGKPWLNEYINTALNPEILSKMTPESQKEFADRLDGNAQWNLFMRSLYADGQRIREVGAWRSGVIAYANALRFKGDKPEDATDKAFQRLVTDNLGFPLVHGEPVMVSKVRRDGTARTDPEIADYGRRLTNALRDVPPQHIKTEDENGIPYFLTLPMLPGDDELTHQHLRDIITSQGFYRPSPDGQSASLYLLDSDGVEFQLRDKNNRPLEIDLDELPEFGTKRYSVFGVGGAYGMGGKMAIHDKVSATYDGKVAGWAPYWKNQRLPIPERIKELRAP